MKKNIDLSVIILSYNTKGLLKDCLDSLAKVNHEASLQILVPDNGSTDGSVEMIKRSYPNVVLIENGKNLGFAAGNNRARRYCRGKNILFLNSDTVVKTGTIKETLKYLANHHKVGALTCKILLPSGELDKDARRSFINPWIGLVHLFLRLDRLFPRSRLFAQYWYGYLSDDEVHEVDVLQGAFFLVKKNVLDKTGWFDENYFLDGEDVDLCWRIKEKGWKIIYYPKVAIIHYKGSSKGKVVSGRMKKVKLRDRLMFRLAGVNSMEIFYKKHLWQKYPLIINYLVVIAIKLMKILRLINTVFLG